LKKMYVGNLSFQTSEDSIEASFAAFGTVQSVSIVRDRHTGQSRGFAFVEMQNDEEAAAAIAGLKQHEIDGRMAVVNEAHPRARSSGGSGGRPRSVGRGHERGPGW